jgi:hypothetical protein
VGLVQSLPAGPAAGLRHSAAPARYLMRDPARPDREMLSGLLRDGLSVKQNSDRTGCSTAGVYNLIRRHQLTPPVRRPHRTGRDPIGWTRR